MHQALYIGDSFITGEALIWKTGSGRIDQREDQAIILFYAYQYITARKISKVYAFPVNHTDKFNQLLWEDFKGKALDCFLTICKWNKKTANTYVRVGMFTDKPVIQKLSAVLMLEIGHHFGRFDTTTL